MSNRYASVHTNPQGPGDARPTAVQIIQDENLFGELTGKVALITGTSSGIGIETALALKAAGMHVFGAVRNIPKATEALGTHISPGKLELLELDMTSLASVRACAQDFLRKSSKLHILITNAGIMMPPHTLTKDGFESQFGVNHLAHFLLFQLLAPTLLASASPVFPARVVVLSSAGHRNHALDLSDLNFQKREYDPVAAYAQSKLAGIYMANSIERRFASRHLHGLSVMPGGIWTGLQANLPAEVVQGWKGDEGFMRAFKSAEQGAATTVWGAVGKELEGRGGVYLEDCGVAELAVEEGNLGLPGYGEWAFDEEREEGLWEVSCGMVGVGGVE
ncbi:NAD(P)-binding protein [Ophiobolus disseminans]|uniref:NAD(P)-binding protein n=1 Tax=Ophiobolus disseminans TaxID=1469910 RepID=A0A6A7A9H4_9PLEO|nr:NAD(P)-binding protein [Ophiobolus disseminans]